VLGLERHAHITGRVPDKETHELRGRELGGEDQIALVLPVFTVHDDHGPSRRDVGDGAIDAVEVGHCYGFSCVFFSRASAAGAGSSMAHLLSGPSHRVRRGDARRTSPGRPPPDSPDRPGPGIRGQSTPASWGSVTPRTRART